MNGKLVVTPEQLREGFQVFCMRGQYVTDECNEIKQPNGNFVVEVPSPTLFLGMYTNKPLYGEPNEA